MAWLHIFQEDNGVRLVAVSSFSGQNVAEEGGAHTEHEFVGLKDDGLAGATGQRHVGQELGGAQVLNDAEETVVVVVPLKQEFLLSIVVLHFQQVEIQLEVTED